MREGSVDRRVRAIAAVDALQGPKRRAEQLAQLVFAREPQGVLQCDGIQRPFGGAVEPENRSGVEFVRLDRHVAHREGVAVELRALEAKGVSR